jgi:hypothetical protein
MFLPYPFFYPIGDRKRKKKGQGTASTQLILDLTRIMDVENDHQICEESPTSTLARELLVD